MTWPATRRRGDSIFAVDRRRWGGVQRHHVAGTVVCSVLLARSLMYGHIRSLQGFVWRVKSCCEFNFMRTIIAGSRTAERHHVYNAMRDCPFTASITEVVSGRAPRGADRYGEVWAESNNLPIKPFPADWHKHGRAAGILRNIDMANYADALVAIWDGSSPGTKNMIDKAKSKGLQVFVWRIEHDAYTTRII